MDKNSVPSFPAKISESEDSEGSTSTSTESPTQGIQLSAKHIKSLGEAPEILDKIAVAKGWNLPIYISRPDPDKVTKGKKSDKTFKIFLNGRDYFSPKCYSRQYSEAKISAARYCLEQLFEQGEIPPMEDFIAVDTNPVALLKKFAASRNWSVSYFSKWYPKTEENSEVARNYFGLPISELYYEVTVNNQIYRSEFCGHNVSEGVRNCCIFVLEKLRQVKLAPAWKLPQGASDPEELNIISPQELMKLEMSAVTVIEKICRFRGWGRPRYRHKGRKCDLLLSKPKLVSISNADTIETGRQKTAVNLLRILAKEGAVPHENLLALY